MRLRPELLFATPILLFLSCAGEHQQEHEPEWKRKTPPLWAYVAPDEKPDYKSEPEPPMRFFINTKAIRQDTSNRSVTVLIHVPESDTPFQIRCSPSMTSRTRSTCTRSITNSPTEQFLFSASTLEPDSVAFNRLATSFVQSSCCEVTGLRSQCRISKSSPPKQIRAAYTTLATNFSSARSFLGL